MRTLKRTLALVLALVMVLGFGAFASAAEFTDADQIVNKEAASVMKALGIMIGNPDGTYNPKGTLTRAEAVVMLTRMLGVADLGGKAPFSDLAGYEWAESAIAYCAAEGIVEGYDGKFDPAGQLTGYAWAKMLFGALGYDAKVEGMTGDSWEIGVGKVAKKADAKIFGTDTSDKTLPISRDLAAQFALNALFLQTKTYTGGSHVTIGGVDVVTNADLTDSGTNLATDVFAITKDPDAMDDFGRPGTRYTNPKYFGATGLFVADAPVATFEGAVTEKAIFDVIKDVTGVTARFDEIYEDGTVAYWGLGIDYHKNGAEAAWTAAFTGAGIKTEIYNVGTPAAPVWRLVAVRDYLAKVTTVTPAVAATETKRSIKVTLQDVKPAAAAGYVSEALETEDFALNDYVIVNVAEDAGTLTVKSIAKAATVSGACSKITKNVYGDPIAWVVGGTEYVASQNATSDIASIALGTTAGTYYVDSMGNLIGLYEAATPTVVKYYGFLKTYKAQQKAVGTTNLVSGVTTGAAVAGEKFELITADGTVILDGAMVVNAQGYATSFVNAILTDGAITNADVIDAGQMVEYTLNAAGKVDSVKAAEKTGITNSFVKGNATFTGKSYLLTDKTVFIVKTSLPVPTYTVYVGYTNAPSFTNEAVDYFYTGTTIDAVYVEDIAAAPAATVLYFAGINYYTSLNAAGSTVYNYDNVYVNGVKGSITTATEVVAANTIVAGELWTATITDGVCALTAEQTGNTVTGQAATYFKAGTIKYVNADTKYFVIDTTLKTVTAAEAMPEAARGYDNVVVYADGTAGDATKPATVVYYYVVAE